MIIAIDDTAILAISVEGELVTNQHACGYDMIRDGEAKLMEVGGR